MSVENARQNMQKELPGWDFRNAVAQAKDEWNRELSKIANQDTGTRFARKDILYSIVSLNDCTFCLQ